MDLQTTSERMAQLTNEILVDQLALLNGLVDGEEKSGLRELSP